MNPFIPAAMDIKAILVEEQQWYYSVSLFFYMDGFDINQQRLICH